jgi:Acyl-CoA carboxylase epsilon subunit
MAESEERPLLRIITPDATAEEVAALVAVFASLGTPEEEAPRRRSLWADPSRGMRAAMPHGPGAWRASALPR